MSASQESLVPAGPPTEVGGRGRGRRADLRETSIRAGSVDSRGSRSSHRVDGSARRAESAERKR